MSLTQSYLVPILLKIQLARNLMGLLYIRTMRAIAFVNNFASDEHFLESSFC